MGTLLDTSLLIAVEHGQGRVPDDDEVALAAITAAELLRGVYCASPAARPSREAFVERVLSVIPCLPFTLETARTHARLAEALVERGRVRGVHDLIIAATAIAAGWSLATLDRRGFEGIPGLSLRDVGIS